jgi:hypothetical protein
MGKKKHKLIQIFQWVGGNLLEILIFILSTVLIIFVSKEYLEARGIFKKRGWKAIPGEKTKVLLKNKNGKYEEADLPVIDNKQVTSDEIKHIAKAERKGEYAIQFRHKPKNRRDITADDIDNSSMDI